MRNVPIAEKGMCAGTVVTLLSTEQVHHYKAMLRKIDNTFVKDMPLPAGIISELRPKVKKAIQEASAVDSLS